MIDISGTIQRCLALIEKEVTNLEAKQAAQESLDRRDCENLMDYMRVLMATEKKVEAAEFKTNQELEDAILAEAKKIKELRNQKAAKEMNDQANAPSKAGKSSSSQK